MPAQPNIALVHDWLTRMRGGEKVLEVLCELFPNAPLFTLVHRKGSCSPAIERMNITTSFLQDIPFGQSHYQHFLPLFPLAAKSLDVRDFDLVISSSHAAAKGVRVRDDAMHVCYCHTPMRYIWDQYEQYFGEQQASLPVRLAMKTIRGSLQRWDVKSSKNVNHFIANSENVRQRIMRIYGRDSTVVYPPVDAARFSLSTRDEHYYLIVSALVPYKRIDIAVEAFNHLGEKLAIVGTGSEEKRLKAMAKPNIEFIGWANDDELQKYFSGCRALIFPGEEDFGIVPVEAMACGKPVIAFGKGGALETVVEGKTGLFFQEQSAESLERRVQEFREQEFDGRTIRDHAMKFSRERFSEEMRETIEKFVEQRSR
ncbi:MAG: glycosyltransferase [Ignavibacteriae bacterium]|nr:glycosyltransferase [Ignavibacteria bacterium]MBI3364657.1 glycosyltransferase [Ignavibacteriota bacterium]